MDKEKRFFKALQDVFIGAKIEGKGGFINLMRIKSMYYSQIESLLIEDINNALEKHPYFREELFDKLYSFFNRYFSESGSIYFNSTPFHNNVYEKVYTDERDVVLFWKTQMLYYVKTDRIFRSMPVEFDGLKFLFNAAEIENKKNNEKRKLVFELADVIEDGTIEFKVTYSERGKKTKTGGVLKDLRKKNIDLQEEQLEKAFRVFAKQSEVDYFINKNAKAFLQEQFKLWSYQYFWDGGREWSAERVDQLQILKEIAYKIINFISQFEDELVKIWNKPKFVRKSNYVITLDRIEDKNIRDKLINHENYPKQIKEWTELGIDQDNPKAPVDTKYFKDLELDILALFDNLDQQLDGWLIKSENYQALNTIAPKFKEQVQTIYIDPPFNLNLSKQFYYNVNYKDSNWATLLENRINLAKNLMNRQSSIFVRCDYNGNWIVRNILDNTFNKNYQNELVINRGKQRLGEFNKYAIAVDTLFYYTKYNANYSFHPFTRARYESEAKGTNMLMKGERFPRERTFIDPKGQKVVLVPPPNTHWKFVQSKIDEMYIKGVIYLATSKKKYNSGITKIEGNKQIPVDYVPSFRFDAEKTIDSNWSDISGYSADWGFETENSEQLLNRVIKTSCKQKEIVLDFFLGSGATIAAAQKLGMRWIGIEMGSHFYDIVKPRLLEVLAGKGKHEPAGISKELKWSGGGFFKYYELEQYEEALSNCKYSDGDLFDKTSGKAYQDYVFLKDEKMAAAVEIDYENDKVKVDLNKLYPDIDIAETLSNLTGKWIKSIKKEEVEFTDGTKINTSDLDYRLIKPLIWW